MDEKLGSEHPRSFPSQLRHLLETADGPEQVRAWTEFLDSYSRLILYVARQIPRDHDVVMDRYAFVVERLQEQSYRRLRTFAADGRGKFTTWLMVVVRRLCLDHDRRKYGRAPGPGSRGPTAPRRLVELVLDPEVLDRLPGGGPSADEELERAQILQQLNAAVATLSPSDQLLLTLRYQDDRSAREIASLMSLPTPFHVYRRLNRVHDSLRQALTAPPDRERTTTSAAPDPPAVQYRWSK
jgi:RNA polymerase sigma factor (sigma-70 family)